VLATSARPTHYTMNKDKIIQARYGPIEYGQWVDVKPILDRFPDLQLQVCDIVFTDGQDLWPGKEKILRLLLREVHGDVVCEFESGEILPLIMGTETVKANTDKEISGLRIHFAYYGANVAHEGERIDVTERVRELVQHDSLDIVVNNSTLTPGQNPYRGKKKQLWVNYGYDDGEPQGVVRDEKDWLIIGQAWSSGEQTPIFKLKNQPEVEVVDFRLDNTETARSARTVKDIEDEIEEASNRVAMGITEHDVENAIEDVRREAELRNAENQDKKLAAVELSLIKKALETDWQQWKLKDQEVLLQVLRRWTKDKPQVLTDPPRTAPALNDYLIRKFSISPQRLRGPMPIELRDFHRNDLAQLFAELGFKRGAEIGVAEGRYSEVLLKANPECELLLVDPWHAYSENPQNKPNDKHEFAYNEVVRKTKDYPNVIIEKGYSMDVVRHLLYDSLDFVYVDANHLFDECIQDIVEWSKRVRSGGIVSGDDYYGLDQKRWAGGGVVEAVQAYTNAHRIPIWYIFAGHKSTDFMWVKP